MTATDWHAVHVYYYESDKSALLVDAIGPLLAALHDHVRAAYLLRHWRRGPHIRLNVEATADSWTRVIRPAVDDRIGTYLRGNPSTARLDPDALLPQHRFLARQEQEPGPLLPWIADNSIRYPPWQPRSGVVGGERVADLVTRFYVDSNPLLLDIVESSRHGRDSIPVVAFGLMIGTAHAVGGIRRNVGSFRAHSEGFLAQCSDPDAVRAEFETYYDRHRAHILARVNAVVATLEGTADQPAGFVGDWSDLIVRHADAADPILASGVLRVPHEEREQLLRNARLSEYQRLAFTNDAYMRRALENPHFLRYRVVLNYTYLQLTRLGVSPRQRFLLCHMAANAIEEIHSVSALDFVRRFTQSHPNSDGGSA